MSERMRPCPLPWTVSPLDSRIIVDAEGLVVADLRVPLSEGCHKIALKMAAAPDLLEALKEAVRDFGIMRMGARMEKWDAAIAKAEGRESER